MKVALSTLNYLTILNIVGKNGAIEFYFTRSDFYIVIRLNKIIE